MCVLRRTLIAATLGLVCAIFFLIVVADRNPKFHARSFLKVEVRETHLFPTIYRDEAGTVSNFLTTVEKQLLLATPSTASQNSFVLERVGSVRDTSLFHIDYSGRDSNAVQVAASNAANLAISFYATSQPSWQVTLVETRCYTPLSVSDRLKDSFWVYSQRCKAFLGL